VNSGSPQQNAEGNSRFSLRQSNSLELRAVG